MLSRYSLMTLIHSMLWIGEKDILPNETALNYLQYVRLVYLRYVEAY